MAERNVFAEGYSKEQSRTNISDVHSQVQDLFSDRPDLVAGFERFLPSNSRPADADEAEGDSVKPVGAMQQL
jgi:histone deacetylase complex regulatory component SIN3